MTGQDHTEAVPTTSADGETVELRPDTQGTHELAWSVDDAAEVAPWRRGSRLVWSALVALVVGITAALVFLGTTYFGNARSSRNIESSNKPTHAPSIVTITALPTSNTVQAAPLPTLPTVQAAPPAPAQPVPVFTAEQDQQFLRRIAIHNTISNPDWALENAHRYCVLVAEGISEAKAQKIAESESLTNHPVGNEVGIQNYSPWIVRTDASVDLEWDSLTTEAMVVYPGCR